MELIVKPSPVTGTIPASPSKSYTHRALTLGLLADGRTTLKNVLLSGDTLATLRAVELFGGKAVVKGDTVTIDGGRLSCPDDVIDCANSGTTIRIMAGVASLLPCTTVLTGDTSIRGRPMQPLIESLNELGVECRSTRDNGLAPLLVRGPNRGRTTHIKGDVSSQFISSLLLSSPLKEVDTEVLLTTPLKSRPYVEITLIMMREFGTKASMTKQGFEIEGRQRYKAIPSYKVPGDYSSAAFPLAAGALAGEVMVVGLNPDDKQGDKLMVDILEQFGANVKRGATSVRVAPGRLQGIEVDLSDAPDLFPLVAVIGSQARGVTRIFNAEHVRHKESDRISATTDFLKRMGAKIEEKEDGCLIKGPVQLKGTRVQTLADHRILMAAAIAGLVAEGDTLIDHGDCYRISYPNFLDDMAAIGAEMELVA